MTETIQSSATNRELLQGFADPSIAFARELGRIAKSRSAAHRGEVQPVPEMFEEGSTELREWRREYGHDGRDKVCDRLNQQRVEVAADIHTDRSSTSPSTVGFVLDAAPAKLKSKNAPISGTSKRSTTTTTDQQDRVTSATATSTKAKRSVTNATGGRAAESPEPAAQDEIDRLLKIGLTQQEAHQLVVAGHWNCESLVCAVEQKTTDGIPPRVIGLLRENWKIL